MDTKVSIIIPIYNCEKYLKACLNSVAKQSLAGIQVIMVDDGSTDSSAEICKSFVEKYSFYEYYYKENGGSASARNLGLKKAVGEYIGFVDSDDWIAEDMYEKLYLCAKQNNSTDIVFCRVFEEETPGAKEYIFPRGGYYCREDMRREIFPYILPYVNERGTFRNIRWSNCLRLFRRSLVEDNGITFFEKSRRCEDLAFSFECTIMAKDYYYFDTESFYHNVPNKDSKSRNYSKDMWKSIRNLIVHIDSVSKKCADYDFKDAIRLTSFYFCTMCIKNELKSADLGEARKRIEEILNDKICKENVSVEGVYPFNKGYTGLQKKMKTSSAERVYIYLKWIEIKREKLYPIVSRVRRLL